MGPVGTNAESVDDQYGACRGHYGVCRDEYGAFRDQYMVCRDQYGSCKMTKTGYVQTNMGLKGPISGL